MPENPRRPEPDPIDREPAPKRPAQDKPEPKIPAKTQEDLLEEDRFESTDN